MRVGVYYDGGKEGAAQAALSHAREIRLERNQVLVRDLTVWASDSVERFERVVVFADGPAAEKVVAAYREREIPAEVVGAAEQPATESPQAPARSRRKS